MSDLKEEAQLSELEKLQTENAALRAQITVIQEEIKNAHEALALVNVKLALDHLNEARSLAAKEAVLEIENLFNAARTVVRYQNAQNNRKLRIAINRLGEALCNERLEAIIKAMILR